MRERRELLIARVGAQGDGVAETPSGPVYVPFTLQGERVVGGRRGRARPACRGARAKRRTRCAAVPAFRELRRVRSATHEAVRVSRVEARSGHRSLPAARHHGAGRGRGRMFRQTPPGRVLRPPSLRRAVRRRRENRVSRSGLARSRGLDVVRGRASGHRRGPAASQRPCARRCCRAGARRASSRRGPTAVSMSGSRR